MLTIVVPTYCEAPNMALLLHRIRENIAHLMNYEVLIVDDNSPDDVAEVVSDLAAEFPVRLLQPEGRERDLSLSVIEGIAAAPHDLIIVMDADLSHPPEKIPEMYELLRQHDSTFVLGSRYVTGGSFDRKWSLWRFLNSHIATLLTSPLIKCADPMSGFFGFDRKRILIDELRPIGYKIGLELMVRGDFESVSEVPIRFQDREIGESKMNFTQQRRFLQHLCRLYRARFGSSRIISYLAVGFSGFLVDLVVYLLLQVADVPHHLARAGAFWPAALWNFWLRGRSDAKTHGRRYVPRPWFLVSSLVGFSASCGSYVLLTSQIPFFDEFRLMAFLLGIAAASVVNFLLTSLHLYTEKRF